ncbi:MAG: folate-binding protein YgfZ [Alcaligenaceae bacterium]|jgi:folate-binding protein YgfZ|nr:folate-binding protein YgfZ [Alcaligenaceae bacterium]
MPNSSSPGVNYALLDDFSVLKASGADALEFLQNQFTQDLNLVSAEQAQLSAWCNAKGRSLASFLMWRDAAANDCFYLLIKKDIVEPTLKRLKMFVFRNKVELELLNLPILGLWSEDKGLQYAPEALGGKGSFTVTQQNNQHWIRFPATGSEQRYLLIAGAHSMAEFNPQEVLPKSESFEYTLSDATFWNALDIIQAIAWVELANREEFIPQSINYDAIGAVNFKKGCFPGQEVVARSHYRGTLKRRAFIAYTSQNASDITVGADIFQGDRPNGQVVNIAHLPDNKGTWVLFETRLEAVDGSSDESLHLGSENGPELTVQAPPYPLEKPEN